jgi:ribosomal protein S13
MGIEATNGSTVIVQKQTSSPTSKDRNGIINADQTPQLKRETLEDKASFSTAVKKQTKTVNLNIGEVVGILFLDVVETGKEFVGWINESISNLFADAKETKKAIEEAKASPKDKGKQAVAIERSKGLIKQAVIKANPNISQKAAQKIEAKIATMTDDQIMAIGEKIANDFTIAEKTGDQKVYLSTLKDLDIWGKTIANRTDLPTKVKQSANGVYEKANVAGRAIKSKFQKENAQFLQNNTNISDALKITEEGRVIGETDPLLISISGTIENLDFISPENKAGIKESIADNRALAAEVIQIAEAKGYKLDNFAQLASIAGVGGGEGSDVVATADFAQQLNYLTRFKYEFSSFTQDVLDSIAKDIAVNKELDEASAKIISQKKAEEAEYIRKAQKKIEELRKSIDNITNTKLQNKLRAAVIAMSYILNNPEGIKTALVEAIRDEVNKIKLAVHP